MPSTYKLVVDNGSLSGVTGHHTIQCHVEETLDDGTIVQGIPEVFGIEAIALQRAHDGDPVKWRTWVAGVMADRHKRRQLAHAEIMQWSGKKFDIG
jgi:hypothetical protein